MKNRTVSKKGDKEVPDLSKLKAISKDPNNVVIGYHPLVKCATLLATICLIGITIIALSSGSSEPDSPLALFLLLIFLVITLVTTIECFSSFLLFVDDRIIHKTLIGTKTIKLSEIIDISFDSDRSSYRILGENTKIDLSYLLSGLPLFFSVIETKVPESSHFSAGQKIHQLSQIYASGNKIKTRYKIKRIFRIENILTLFTFFIAIISYERVAASGGDDRVSLFILLGCLVLLTSLSIKKFINNQNNKKKKD